MSPLIFATLNKKGECSRLISLKISKKVRKEYEINFDSRYTALTFALPLKKRVAIKGQKIFESWETIALYPDSHRDKTTR